MQQELIQFAIINIIKDNCSWEGVDSIDENTVVMRDTHCDSLDYVEIVMKMEDEFGVEIADEDNQKLMEAPISKWAEWLCFSGARLPAWVSVKMEEEKKKAKVKPVTEVKTQQPTVKPANIPVKIEKIKPIELVKKDNKTIEFHQDGKVINLDNPKLLPVINKLKAEISLVR